MGQDRDNAIHATDDLVASKLSEGAPCYHIVWFDWFGLLEGRSKNLASSVVADFSSHAMKEADKGTPYTRSVLNSEVTPLSLLKMCRCALALLSLSLFFLTIV